jgi:uncharacterized Zn ribbon protein
VSIEFLPGPIPLLCPECSHEGVWYLFSETVMCDNCAHDWPWVDAYKTALATQEGMEV